MNSSQKYPHTSQATIPGEASESNTIPTVIIGAGPAGLAVAACLRKAQIAPLILEKGDQVGSSWFKYYDRLHLNTDKNCSALPYLPFPSACPKYPSRKDVIAYLKTYARHFELKPRLNEPVLTAQRQDNHWLTRTSAATYRSKNLVVASGNNQYASIPHWEGQKEFQGQILHSRDYQNGRVFKGQNILVVGIGNTGSDIALDLYEHGARVSLCVKGRVNILPRDILGIAVLKTVNRLAHMPMAFSDTLRNVLFNLLCYHLPQYGLVRPAYDPITQANRFGKLPVLDNGTVALIKKGDIKVYPGITRFSKKGIHFENGDSDQFDVVVLATGYRPRLDTFLRLDPNLLDQDGRPRTASCITPVPGLYFCGFTVSSTGILSTIGTEALRICRHISRTEIK